jgi:hypothetical protein
MNQKGNLILFVLIGFALLFVLPFIIFYLFPIAGILFQLLAIFMIYGTVRGYLGNNIMSIVISAIFIYFLVFKYRDIFAATWLVATLLMFGFGSVIMWGIGTRTRHLWEKH